MNQDAIRAKMNDILESRKRIYKSFDVRVAAQKAESDILNNLATKVMLSYNESSNTSEVMLDVGDIVMLHANYDIEKFPSFLNKANQGLIELEGFSIKLSKDGVNWSYYECDSKRAFDWYGVDWFLDLFTHDWSDLQISRSDEIDNKFKRLDKPYESLLDAINNLLELKGSRRVDDYSRSSIRIFMPGYFALRDCELEGDKLDAYAEFHKSINIEGLSLGIILKGRTTERITENFHKSELVEERHSSRVACKQLKVNSPASAVLFLFPKYEESVDEQNLINTKAENNPRFVAHTLFDDDLTIFKEWLKAKEKRNMKFEYAVYLLLHIAGFKVEWTGYWDKDNIDAPDLIAFPHKADEVLVVECTTDIFGDKKIERLVSRARRLSERLALKAIPVMFTPLDSKEIGDSIKEKAGKDKISIISSDEISKIYEMAIRGDLPDEILSYISSLSSSFWWR